MGKRLVLLFCALFVFAAVVPAFAAVQNIKISGDLVTRSITRDDFDLTRGDGVDDEDEINVLNSVVRLRVDADLTDNVSAVIRLINERNWDVATATTSDVDLDLAFVTLKEFLYSPLTVTIGRQELHFGNDMIIGDGVGGPATAYVSGGVGTNQTTNYTEAAGLGSVNGDMAYRKAFDAIRATLDYDPLVIDIVYAKIDENGVTGGSTADDINLYGLNAAYQVSDKWNTLVEGYIWSKVNHDTATVADRDKVYAIGGRVSTNPTKKLNLQAELAWQGGRKSISTTIARDRNAWAVQGIGMYTPGWKYNPTFGLIYSYFSGDAAMTGTDVTKDYHQWDPMFENQTSGRIINALFAATNNHIFDVVIKGEPLEDLSLQFNYVNLLMAKANSANVAGFAINDYNTNGYDFQANKHLLGRELDISLIYDYTEDVQLSLLTGWFWPGSANTKDHSSTGNAGRQTASEAVASVSVSF